MIKILTNDFLKAFHLIDKKEKMKNKKLMRVTVELMDRLFEMGDKKNSLTKNDKREKFNEKR